MCLRDQVPTLFGLDQHLSMLSTFRVQRHMAQWRRHWSITRIGWKNLAKVEICSNCQHFPQPPSPFHNHYQPLSLLFNHQVVTLSYKDRDERVQSANRKEGSVKCREERKCGECKWVQLWEWKIQIWEKHRVLEWNTGFCGIVLGWVECLYHSFNNIQSAVSVDVPGFGEPRKFACLCFLFVFAFGPVCTTKNSSI